MRGAADRLSSAGFPLFLEEMLDAEKWIVPLAVAALSTTGYAQTQQPASPPPIKRTPLGKVDVQARTTGRVRHRGLVPGPKTGRHSHPGIVMAYVAEGEFWYLIDGQRERWRRRCLPGFGARGSQQGAVGTRPAKVIAVYIVEKGKPLVQPAVAPTHRHSPSRDSSPGGTLS